MTRPQVFLRIYISGNIIKKIEIILRTKYRWKHYASDVLHILLCTTRAILYSGIFHDFMKIRSLFIDTN